MPIRVPILAFVALTLTASPIPGPCLLAQTAGDTAQLTGSVPAELMVDRRSGRTEITLLGEGINDQDAHWTARLHRYYVRRAGESAWRRLYLHGAQPWWESQERLAPLRANGEWVGWTHGSSAFALPNDLYLHAPGALEFRVEKGHWKERTVGEGEEASTVADYVVDAASNVLRIPIRPAPTEAPVVTHVAPNHLPVLRAGRPRAEITVHADNLMPDAQATVGAEPCDIATIDPAGGTLRCFVPASLQSEPGTYLVGVSTENGGARRMARLEVDAPLALDRPDPPAVPVADTGAAVLIAYKGAFPFDGRLRVEEGDWVEAGLADAGRLGVRVEIPASLTRQPGTVEIQLANATGPAIVRLLVCGPGEEQPDACRTVARAPIQAARTPAAQERPKAVLDPGAAVALRPQPEPPGLLAMPLSQTATLRLADGRALSWRTVDGAKRLVLLDEEGKTLQVYPEGAQPARDADGRVFVCIENGVLPLGVRAAGRGR